MPRNNRQWAQRKLNSCKNNLETAATHLQEVANIYRQTQAVNVAENCIILCQALSDIPGMIDKIYITNGNIPKIIIIKINTFVKERLTVIHDNLILVKEEIAKLEKYGVIKELNTITEGIFVIAESIVKLKSIF